MRRALLLVLAAVALAAGCGGGGDDADGTIEQLRIAYTSGSRTLTADTWTLQGATDVASRSRLRDGGVVTSDVALRDGFLSLYTPEAGGVVQSPAGSAPSAEPFGIADALVDAGDLTAAGTVERDGRTLEAFTGPAEPFVLAAGEGRLTPAGAKVRYLRDRDSGQPVELRIPAVRIAASGAGSAALPAQRYVVEEYREYPATEEAMEVFDLSAVYDGAGATTAP